MSRVAFDFESVPAGALGDGHLRQLPHRPCVLRVFDHNDNLILLEKTHNLATRLERFYSDSPRPGAVDLRGISDRIEFCLTDSPFEALYLLYLERRHRFPSSYRRMKTFPLVHLIEIDMRARFPRIATARNITGGRRYFGPYRNRTEVEQVKATAERTFRIRPCDYDIRGDDPYPDCLYFQMETCSRPCNGDIGAGEYSRDVTAAIDLILGQDDTSLMPLIDRIRALAEEMRFEEAEQLRLLLARTRRGQAEGERQIFEVGRFDFAVLLKARSTKSRKLALVRGGRIISLEEHSLDRMESTIPESLARAVARPVLPESAGCDRQNYDEFCLCVHFLFRPLKTIRFFPLLEPDDTAKAILEHLRAAGAEKPDATGVSVDLTKPLPHE